MELVHKVFAYITHGNRLLIFDHVDFPDDLPQVPAGTRAQGEDPESAVLREAYEETGLEGLRLASFLGEVDFRYADAAPVARRRFYHLRCRETPLERWRHAEEHPSDGSPGPIWFEHYWVDLDARVPQLSPGHDAFLDELRTRLKSGHNPASSPSGSGR